MGFTNVPRAGVLTSGTAAGDPYLQFGDPFAVNPTSRWGIDAAGAPYFNAAGAAAGESATANLDAFGAPYLSR